MTEQVRAVRRNIGVVVFVVVFLGVSLYTLDAVRDLGDRFRRADALAQVRAEQARTLADQVRQLGGVPKVSPPPAPIPAQSGAPGKTGASGAPGRAPTQAEVSAAVSVYLKDNPPPEGRAPTMAEIITAVSGYLQEHPPAAGPAGPAGEKGDKGDQGDPGATGPQGDRGEQGPPPTDEQIRAAVAAYFDSHTFTCEPEDPAGGVTGGSFRCTVNP